MTSPGAEGPWTICPGCNRVAESSRELTALGCEGRHIEVVDRRVADEAFDAGYAQAIKDVKEALEIALSVDEAEGDEKYGDALDFIERRFSALGAEGEESVSGSVASYEHGAGSALSGKGAGAHDAPSGTTPGPDSQPASPETERAEDGC